MTRPTQRFEITKRMRLRVSIRLDMMHLNAVSAAARYAFMVVSLKRFSPLSLPNSDVWRCPSPAPEMALSSSTALRAALDPALPRAADFIGSSKDLEFGIADDTAARFLPVPPSELPIAGTRAKAVVRRAGRVRLLTVHVLRTIAANDEAPSAPATCDVLCAFVPRGRPAGERTILGAIAEEKRLPASLAWNGRAASCHMTSLPPLKHEYWRQAVENLKGVAAQADMFAA
jgi:hypothetical protein